MVSQPITVGQWLSLAAASGDIVVHLSGLPRYVGTADTLTVSATLFGVTACWENLKMTITKIGDF